MKKEVMLTLIRPARKDGGDRYESEDGIVVFYIPQHLSRQSGTPLSKIKVTLEEA